MPPFEQIKKQLNRCVEVIEVIDFTNSRIHRKEVLYIKIKDCDEAVKTEIFRIATIFYLAVVDYGKTEMLLESLQTEKRNDEIISYFSSYFKNIEVVRGGSVAIKGVSIQDKSKTGKKWSHAHHSMTPPFSIDRYYCRSSPASFFQIRNIMAGEQDCLLPLPLNKACVR